MAIGLPDQQTLTRAILRVHDRDLASAFYCFTELMAAFPLIDFRALIAQQESDVFHREEVLRLMDNRNR